MRIRAGNLRHQVTFRRAAQQQDAKGGIEQLWTTVATCGAMVEGIDGREALIAMAFTGVAHIKVTIRYRADLKVSDQLVLPDGSEYNIRSIADRDGRRNALMILADTASVQDEAA